MTILKRARQSTRILDQSNGDDLRRTWQLVHRSQSPDAIYILVNRSFKVYANLGRTTSALSRQLGILDTSAGRKFIYSSLLPASYDAHIEHEPPLKFYDANNNALPIRGAIRATAQMVSSTVSAWFWVAKGHSTPHTAHTGVRILQQIRGLHPSSEATVRLAR